MTIAMDNVTASGELGELEEPDHFVQRSRDVSIKMSDKFRVSSQYPATFSEGCTSPGLHRDKQKDDERREDFPQLDLQERRSKTLSTGPDLVKKNINVNGGIMEIDDIELNVGPGCLAEDTEITIKDVQNPAFKSLLDLDLVKAVPRVVEFLPDGLQFLKPAKLSIKYEKITSDAELCILHGSNNSDDERTVWEQLFRWDQTW